MILLLLIVIACLLIVVVFQFYSKRTLQKQVDTIVKHVTPIVENQTNGPILLATADRHVANLLIALNKLIDQNRAHTSHFIRTEQSMKHMLANMSHDLKTPLTVIAGYAEMLQAQASMSESEQKRIINHIYEKTEEINSLIHSFFDLAKLEAGDKQIPLDRVNVTEICKQTILMFYELITNEGITVDLDLPDRPLYALANEEALNRILSNLLSNALRYGASGKVIGLHVFEENQYISIEVFDRGTGIQESDQQKIFERMYTLEESRNKHFQGSGLGLTITKRLVEQMQGTISVVSKPNEKTSFVCKLKRVNP